MNNQYGLSVLEILFSLAVTAVILVMVANYYYTQNQRYMQVTQAAAQIQQIANVSYEWQTAQQQIDFKGIDFQTLQTAGLLAEDDFSQVDPWGEKIVLTADPTDAHYLQITLPKISPYACVNLRDKMNKIAHNQTSEKDCVNGSYKISM